MCHRTPPCTEHHVRSVAALPPRHSGLQVLPSNNPRSLHYKLGLFTKAHLMTVSAIQILTGGLGLSKSPTDAHTSAHTQRVDLAVHKTGRFKALANPATGWSVDVEMDKGNDKEMH